MNKTIIVDAHGGDNAPLEIVKGCARAVELYKADIILVGRENEIRQAAQTAGVSIDGIRIRHTEDVITMEDEPIMVVRSKKNSSMAVGLTMLANGEGGAFVSAGSTGALVVGTRLIVKNIKCIRRAALAALLPSNNGAYMLIDSGANVECQPEMLRDFAIMGSAYMSGICGIENPRVGLLCNGTEEHKGTDLTRTAKELINQTNINFVGYVEGRDAPLGGCDVLVTDGFSGNIYIKTCEGMGKLVSNSIKASLKKNPIRMIGALLVGGALKELKKSLDYSEYGGAPLMGAKMPVIKAHGTADAKIMASTIKQAISYIENDIGDRIEQMLCLDRKDGEKIE